MLAENRRAIESLEERLRGQAEAAKRDYDDQMRLRTAEMQAKFEAAAKQREGVLGLLLFVVVVVVVVVIAVFVVVVVVVVVVFVVVVLVVVDIIIIIIIILVFFSFFLVFFLLLTFCIRFPLFTIRGGAESYRQHRSATEEEDRGGVQSRGGREGQAGKVRSAFLFIVCCFIVRVSSSFSLLIAYM
jgi:hypothetical protein